MNTYYTNVLDGPRSAEPDVGALIAVPLDIVGSAAHHSGLLRFFVNEENMMLKLILILSSSLAFGSTECCR